MHNRANGKRNDHQRKPVGLNSGRKSGGGSKTRERTRDREVCTPSDGDLPQNVPQTSMAAKCLPPIRSMPADRARPCLHEWFRCLPNCADPVDGHEAMVNCRAKADRLQGGGCNFTGG